MLYIISEIENDKPKPGYANYGVFDTQSHSVMWLKPDMLKNIITNNKLKIANDSVQEDQIVLKDWTHGIAVLKFNQAGLERSGPKYILLVIKDDKGIIVDYKGIISASNRREIERIAKAKNIANCELIENGSEYRLSTTDTYTVYKDEEFERLIAEKYSKFILKTNMLGIGGISFNYEIENHEVKLQKYTGSNQNVILPSFITVIMEEAFEDSSIKTIKLNAGLKVIGARAFADIAGYRDTRNCRVNRHPSI